MSIWMIRSDRLDPTQKHFISQEVKNNKNIWIKGFPGSGKSILLVHTIVEKLKENPDASICIVVFTHSLIQMFTVGMEELNIPHKNVYLTTYHNFIKDNVTYDYIFCDEVQDLPKSILENMKGRTKQLIVAGDSNQSIYADNPSTREPTVTPSEIGSITNSDPYELMGIHRLTKSIINAIGKFLPEMNIFSAKKLRKDNDVSVKLGKANSKNQEVEYVLSNAEEAISVDENVVIIMPTHEDIIQFVKMVLDIKNINQWQRVNDRWGKKPDWHNLNHYLDSNNVKMQYIGNKDGGDLYNSVRLGKIIIMTYHSAKGLDFDNVFLPFLSKGAYLWSKTVFMVGMTRSKMNLYLTYSGNMHEYVSSFQNECTKIDIGNILNSTPDIDFDF